jgi:hypothetical protein
MGLRATIAGAVDSAFKALGDIPQNVTFRRISKTYSPTTGTWTDTNSDSTVQAVLTSYAGYEIDKVVVLVSDRKLIAKQSSFSVVPNVTSDRILVGSTVFNIIRVVQDPAGATYTLQLRSA